KGRNTKEKVLRNFGQPRPEGFRKALRVMKMAEKFKLPIFSFVDTQGAYPGVGAEERGQAEAIAMNLREMASIEVPIIISVIDEIVPEPPGGAHSDSQAAADLLAPFLERALKDVQKLKGSALLEERYKKFRRIGVFEKS